LSELDEDIIEEPDDLPGKSLLPKAGFVDKGQGDEGESGASSATARNGDGGGGGDEEEGEDDEEDDEEEDDEVEVEEEDEPSKLVDEGGVDIQMGQRIEDGDEDEKMEG